MWVTNHGNISGINVTNATGLDTLPLRSEPVHSALVRAHKAKQSIERWGRVELRIPITSADGLAKWYLQLYDQFDMTPPTHLPQQCAVEELHERCFPLNHFDVTH